MIAHQNIPLYLGWACFPSHFTICLSRASSAIYGSVWGCGINGLIEKSTGNYWSLPRVCPFHQFWDFASDTLTPCRSQATLQHWVASRFAALAWGRRTQDVWTIFDGSNSLPTIISNPPTSHTKPLGKQTCSLLNNGFGMTWCSKNRQSCWASVTSVVHFQVFLGYVPWVST